MSAVLNPNDPNVALLETVANRLGKALRNRLVFVGGAVVGLLITDPAMPSIRPTQDVDLIAEVLARADFYELENLLRAQGFAQDLRPDAPICRWQVDHVTVDVMPTLQGILGFTNRWYDLAVSTAQPIILPSGTTIHVVRAPVFIATKLEAFAGRGGGDYLFSHDLGDLLSVVDGRDTLLDEYAACPPALRAYLAQSIGSFLTKRAFIEALPGHLPGDAASQARLPDLQAKLQRLAQWPNP
jgi:predicted nucleotidyltransferase